MNIPLLLRLTRWMRRPPPRQRLLLIAAVVALVLALYAVEQLAGWPDWLTPAGGARGLR